MKSFKPYLLQAAYDHMLDNNLSPVLQVDLAGYDYSKIPTAYLSGTRIALRIAPDKVYNFAIHHDVVSFDVEFPETEEGRNVINMNIPMEAIESMWDEKADVGIYVLGDDNDDWSIWMDTVIEGPVNHKNNVFEFPGTTKLKTIY